MPAQTDNLLDNLARELGVGPPQEMVLSEVGMVHQSEEVTHHMRNYPYKPLDQLVAEGMNATFEGEFDQMRTRTLSALGVPEDIINE